MTGTYSFLPSLPKAPRRLTFAPLAWLKLQFFCHAGATEIAGFGLTAQHDLLYVEKFITVRQLTSPVTVSMDDQAVADFLDECVDAGLAPQRFLRIWCHTHPGASAQPSQTDEETFARVFGSCDWAVMLILSRTANTSARLSFHVGPGASVQLPVVVDWSAWPALLHHPEVSMDNLLVSWQQEFAANIQHFPEPLPTLATPALEPSIPTARPWEPLPEAWDWDEFNEQLLEEFERHEHSLGHDPRT